jgi:hypothetical protein
MSRDKRYYGFIAPHPEISLRQPEATSVARARGFCKENVTGLFSVLDKTITKITWMLVGYLIWMNLPFRLSNNHKK